MVFSDITDGGRFYVVFSDILRTAGVFMSGRSEGVVPNELPPDEDWQFLFDIERLAHVWITMALRNCCRVGGKV